MSARVTLSRAARDCIAQSGARAYPREACGVLLGEARAGGWSVREARSARNLAAAPGRFELDPGAIVAAGAELLGFWHSHADAPPEPSRADAQGAWSESLCLIVATSIEGAQDMRAFWSRAGALEALEIEP